MNCQQVQVNLSLYLYGELSFQKEDDLEQHLSGCAFCQRALAREKSWHATLQSESQDVPLPLLAACRDGLKRALSSEAKECERKGSAAWEPRPRWTDWFRFSATRWSAQLALGSFLLFVGFSVGQYVDKVGFWKVLGSGSATDMSVVTPATARIRDIQTDSDNRVRIIIDRVQEQQIDGTVEDENVRKLLISAMSDPMDPGIRVDSVDVLKGHGGADVRDALLNCVRSDASPAVRIRALQALRPFEDDPATQDALKFVLEHDEDAGVRSQAIDMLAPPDDGATLTPDLINVLQGIIRSERADDYLRSRCVQTLTRQQASGDIY